MRAVETLGDLFEQWHHDLGKLSRLPSDTRSSDQRAFQGTKCIFGAPKLCMKGYSAARLHETSVDASHNDRSRAQ